MSKISKQKTEYNNWYNTWYRLCNSKRILKGKRKDWENSCPNEPGFYLIRCPRIPFPEKYLKIGIGPGAVSRFFHKNKRTQIETRKDPNGWSNSVQMHSNGIKSITSETIEDFWNEKLLMGLRLVKGVNIKPIKNILNMNKVHELVDANFLNLNNYIMKTTFNGRLRLNSILIEIIK